MHKITKKAHIFLKSIYKNSSRIFKRSVWKMRHTEIVIWHVKIICPIKILRYFLIDTFHYVSTTIYGNDYVGVFAILQICIHVIACGYFELDYVVLNLKFSWLLNPMMNYSAFWKKIKKILFCRCSNTKEKHLSLEYDNKHLTTFVTCCLNRTNDQNNIT